MAEQDTSGTGPAAQGGRSMRLRIDEQGMNTGYANAFRTHVTGEEVLLDFGLNLPMAAGGSDVAATEMLFRVTQRVVLSPQTAKRLAITLAQVVREHESRFGELKIDSGRQG